MTSRRALGHGAAIALAATLLAGCSGSDEPSGQDGGGGLDGELVVYAAASLTESFERIGDEFEAANPGVSVTFNFAGSSTLAQQINEGAPADVFASAAPANMQAVLDAGNAVGTPTIFARNQLVIAVPAGNPHAVTGLDDLVEQDLSVALCAEEVPCGAAAATAIEASGVALTPVTYEQDVRATLGRVTLGEVDAALVYRTDVTATAEVEAVEFPESASAVNDYPIIVLGAAPNSDAGQAFVSHVLSPAGQAVLAEAGFLPPT